MPTGSWDIPLLRLNPIEDYGIFAAPRLRAEDPCFVTWHNDLGFAINAATDHPQEAAAFISYLSSDEFLKPMEEHLPSFFAMRPTGSPTTNPLVNAFIAAKDSCETTQRLSLNQYFNMSGRYYDTLSSTLIDVMRHRQSPQEAAAHLDAQWGK